MNWVLAIFRFQHQYSQSSCTRAVQWTNSGSRNPSALHARSRKTGWKSAFVGVDFSWVAFTLHSHTAWFRAKRERWKIFDHEAEYLGFTGRTLIFCFFWSILCVSSTEPAKTASVVEFGISGFGKIDNPQFFLLSHNTVLWLLLLKTCHWGTTTIWGNFLCSYWWWWWW